jgi:hypothetical protein
MAFDPKEHVVDPESGFLVHKDGRLVGLTPPPLIPAEPTEYPKFVHPHPSHIMHDPRSGRFHVEGWPYHLDRDNVVTVMVKDADEELAAVSKVMGAAVHFASDFSDEHFG